MVAIDFEKNDMDGVYGNFLVTHILQKKKKMITKNVNRCSTEERNECRFGTSGR